MRSKEEFLLDREEWGKRWEKQSCSGDLIKLSSVGRNIGRAFSFYYLVVLFATLFPKGRLSGIHPFQLHVYISRGYIF